MRRDTELRRQSSLIEHLQTENEALRRRLGELGVTVSAPPKSLMGVPIQVKHICVALVNFLVSTGLLQERASARLLGLLEHPSAGNTTSPQANAGTDASDALAGATPNPRTDQMASLLGRPNDAPGDTSTGNDSAAFDTPLLPESSQRLAEMKTTLYPSYSTTGPPLRLASESADVEIDDDPGAGNVPMEYASAPMPARPRGLLPLPPAIGDPSQSVPVQDSAPRRGGLLPLPPGAHPLTAREPHEATADSTTFATGSDAGVGPLLFGSGAATSTGASSGAAGSILSIDQMIPYITSEPGATVPQQDPSASAFAQALALLLANVSSVLPNNQSLSAISNNTSLSGQIIHTLPDTTQSTASTASTVVAGSVEELLQSALTSAQASLVDVDPYSVDNAGAPNNVSQQSALPAPDADLSEGEIVLPTIKPPTGVATTRSTASATARDNGNDSKERLVPAAGALPGQHAQPQPQLPSITSLAAAQTSVPAPAAASTTTPSTTPAPYKPAGLLPKPPAATVVAQTAVNVSKAVSDSSPVVVPKPTLATATGKQEYKLTAEEEEEERLQRNRLRPPLMARGTATAKSSDVHSAAVPVSVSSLPSPADTNRISTSDAGGLAGLPMPRSRKFGVAAASPPVDRPGPSPVVGSAASNSNDPFEHSKSQSLLRTQISMRSTADRITSRHQTVGLGATAGNKRASGSTTTSDVVDSITNGERSQRGRIQNTIFMSPKWCVQLTLA
jgi:hypothetical protein